jgi:hypothetical protein
MLKPARARTCISGYETHSLDFLEVLASSHFAKDLAPAAWMRCLAFRLEFVNNRSFLGKSPLGAL